MASLGAAALIAALVWCVAFIALGLPRYLWRRSAS